MKPVRLALAGVGISLIASFSDAAEGGRISLDSVGYLPARPKKATLVGAAGPFSVVRLRDRTVVFASTAAGPITDRDTGDQFLIADFSALSEPGEYALSADGVSGQSRFDIRADVYVEPFQLVTRAMYLWRCGMAVEGEHQGVRFGHGACHRDDALLDHVGGRPGRRPSVGGWHDAGDYNKYVVNAGAAAGVMFRAWEDFGDRIQRAPLDLPEAGGKLPEFLAELKWEIDWLLTMQADDGAVWHKVSTLEFGPFVMPERENLPRYFAPWSSAATADFVALTAMAARCFAPFDGRYAGECLQAARTSYAFLEQRPRNHPPDLRAFNTGGYDSPDADDRLWAAAELWESTGENEFLTAFESRLSADFPTPNNRDRANGPITVDADWDWSNLRNLGLLTYLNSKRSGRDPALVDGVRSGLLAAAEGIVSTAAEHPYGRPLGDRYYWGCNGTVARQTLVLQAAYRLTSEQRYRDAALDAIHHLFGRNGYGRCFVTGLGANPPLHPHDRRSGADGLAPPWPGYLVGGPHPHADSWQDDQDDYRTNEVAINWNAALIYALAGFLDD
ncbi:MAG: glycoside hydrolase family 9 protein [Pirellulales bacterium]|nr:glycoside hydrolase family 9 protein [Pirellulales bacterium]